MRVALCATTALMAIQPLLGNSARAQIAGRCSTIGSGLRTAAGAGLGAWIGFVVAKAKLSDWNEGSHSPAAIRQRNQITIAGAVVGAVVTHLAFRHPCRGAVGPFAGAGSESAGRREITLEEIQKSGVTGTVWDVVYSLRRTWLSTRGVSSINETPHYVHDEDGNERLVQGQPELIVYLDEMRLGSVNQLRQLPMAGVVAVRYYDPSQATFRWGAGHSRGAIQVISVTDGSGSLRPPPNLLIAPLKHF